MSIPNIPKDIIDYLAKAFPNELPEGTQSDLNEINVRIGEQRVIALLKAQHQYQEEETYV